MVSKSAFDPLLMLAYLSQHPKLASIWDMLPQVAYQSPSPPLLACRLMAQWRKPYTQQAQLVAL
jgi:hypothetical protein